MVQLFMIVVGATLYAGVKFNVIIPRVLIGLCIGVLCDSAVYKGKTGRTRTMGTMTVIFLLHYHTPRVEYAG